MNQEELLYAATHEWVHIGEDGVATIGISDFAVEQLTDLVYMELPQVGATVTAGEEFGEVESVAGPPWTRTGLLYTYRYFTPI